MTSLTQQIEQMRIRMNELAKEEHGLVRSLADRLADADQRLLEEVRNVAVEHEARRGEILRELQMLAARMGALPRPQAPVAALENASQQKPPSVTEPVARGVDWRQAAANIREELALHLKTRAG